MNATARGRGSASDGCEASEAALATAGDVETLVQAGEELDHLDLLAKWFRGLDDPVRLGILEELRGGEKSVDELCEELGMRQPRISNHLACLRWCRFVATRRQGQRIFYRLADPNVAAILDLAHASLARNAARVFACPRA